MYLSKAINIIEKLYYPQVWITLYLFVTLTSVHAIFGFLKIIHIEFLAVCMILICAFVRLFITKQWRMSKFIYLCASLVLLNICVPVISSLVNSQYLQFVERSDFRGYAAMLLMSPLIILFSSPRDGQKTGSREALLWTSMVIVAGLCFLAFYRYFILNEFMEDGDRPLFKTKLGDPNFLSTFVGAFVPLILWKIKKNLNLKLNLFCWKNIGLLFFLFLSVYLLLLLKSRMGILAVAAAMLFLMFAVDWLIKNKTKAMILVTVSLTSLMAFSGSIGDRFLNIVDKSNIMRVASWRFGWRLFLEKPYFGHGWAKATIPCSRIDPYPLFESEFQNINVHNLPLQILAEQGLFGFLCYFSFFALCVFFVYVNIRRKKEVGTFSLAVLLILTMNFITLPVYGKDFIVFIFTLLICLNIQEQNDLSLEKR